MRIIRLAPSPWPIRAGRTRGADAMAWVCSVERAVPTGSGSWRAAASEVLLGWSRIQLF